MVDKIRTWKLNRFYVISYLIIYLTTPYHQEANYEYGSERTPVFRCHSDSLLYAFSNLKVDPIRLLLDPSPVWGGGAVWLSEYDEGTQVYNKVLYQNSLVELCDFVQKQVQFVPRNV